MMKGIIALDIDGTITVDHHPIPPDVLEYFQKLFQEGWKFIFVTGRTFSWGYSCLEAIPFPYYFAVQNGALLLEMPSRKIIAKKYLSRNIIPVMETICHSEPTDFVIYTGLEMDDICYYRSKFFSPELLKYLKKRVDRLEERWENVESFNNVRIESFPSVKCFGKEDSALRINGNIEYLLGLHAPMNRDAFDNNYFIVQATHPEIDKGKALSEFISHISFSGPVIAAGDDMNDIPMLRRAHHKIVMTTAPEEVLALADIVAPPASEKGIIEGLQKIIKKIC